MMAPSEAISTLAGSSVPEDVAVELFDADFNGAFLHATSWVDEFSDIFFARHCDLYFSCVSVVGACVRGSSDRCYFGDFDAKVYQELLDVFVGHACKDAKEDPLMGWRSWGVELGGDRARLECAPGVLIQGDVSGSFVASIDDD